MFTLVSVKLGLYLYDSHCKEIHTHGLGTLRHGHVYAHQLYIQYLHLLMDAHLVNMYGVD